MNNKPVNLYEIIPKKFLLPSINNNFDLHGIKLPARILCVAPSGSGKTNKIVELIGLFSKNKGTFKSIQIITAQKNEPLYDWLIEKSDGSISITEGLNTIPNLDDFDKKENHLIIFDDLVLDKQIDKVSVLFLRGRKKNVSVCMISQSYYSIPKFIRINSTHLFILKLGGARDLRMVLAESAITLDKKQLIKMYEYATAEKFNFLNIHLEQNDGTKYRKNFLEILAPEDYN
jgi:hypothetical protein